LTGEAELDDLKQEHYAFDHGLYHVLEQEELGYTFKEELDDDADEYKNEDGDQSFDVALVGVLQKCARLRRKILRWLFQVLMKVIFLT
ncbi:MAG: hypothetical protein ACRDBG_25175, partial [Waterburya sp.]